MKPTYIYSFLHLSLFCFNPIKVRSKRKDNIKMCHKDLKRESAFILFKIGTNIGLFVITKINFEFHKIWLIWYMLSD
jgi:hypothetical protein